MRLNNTRNLYKPGAIRGRGQWVVFGIALGVIAALAFHSQCSWVMRHELATGLPGSKPNIDPIAYVELVHPGLLDDKVLSAVSKYARSRAQDIPVQMAANMLQEMARVSRANPSLPPQQSGGRYAGEGKTVEDLQTKVSEDATSGSYLRYSNSPVAISAYLRTLAATGLGPQRKEVYWISGKPAPEPPSATSVASRIGSAGPSAHTASVHAAASLSELEQIAAAGIQSDPQNGFFHMVLAAIHFNQRRDEDALEDIDSASKTIYWDDCTLDAALGWQRLDCAVFGQSTYTQCNTLFISESYPQCNNAIRNAARIAIWKAIEMEHNGDYTNAVALRMRIARIGASCARSRPRSTSVELGGSIVTISSTGAGAIYSAPMLNEIGYEYTARCQDVYLRMLKKHGYAAEAAWYKPIFDAQRSRDSRNYYEAATLSSDDDAAYHAILLVWGTGYGLIAEIILAVIVGLALAVSGYRRRFEPVREVYWSKNQWAGAMGGCLIAYFVLAACANLYHGSLSVLAVIVILATFAVQRALRHSECKTNPANLLLSVISLTACLFVAIGFSAVGFYNSLFAGAVETGMADGGSGSESAFAALCAIGMCLLVLPALVTFGIIVWNRVRYKAIPSGLINGTRSVILPMISLMLFVWAACIVGTVGAEKFGYAQLAKDYGVPVEAIYK